ncbi:MAG TPA: hypothetical protein VN030_07790 [Cellvibrio sp.]|nr:hypothetical protein [Cellvibrio sp.]
MSTDTTLPHLGQAAGWKRLLHERLETFAGWDERYQILSSLCQSSLYKIRQQLRNDTFYAASIGSSYDLIISTRNDLAQRLTDCNAELISLRDIAPQQSSIAMQQMEAHIANMREQYSKQVRSLETSSRLFEAQRTALLKLVSDSLLQQQVDDTVQAMRSSWTTFQLGRAATDFFEGIDNSLSHLEREIERVNGLLVSIYKRPEHNVGDSGVLSSRLLKISHERKQLNILARRAADFGFSLANVFTRKSVLIKHFFRFIVEEVRNSYQNLNQYIDQLMRDALLPLLENNKQQKQAIEKQLQRLAELQKSDGGSSENIAMLQVNIEYFQSALTALEPLYLDVLQVQQQAEQARVRAASVTRPQVAELRNLRQAVVSN